MARADGSKYTRTTADGYLGVRSANKHTFKFAIGSLEGIDWPVGTELFVRDGDVEPGIVVQAAAPAHAIAEATVIKDSGPAVHVPPRAIKWLDVQADADCRVYRARDGDGVLVVPADRDPLVDGDQDE